MKIGANYTPSQGWFHSWLDLDIDATRRDFEGIAQLGLDHVRLFPLWPLLQPNRGLVRPRALDDVVSVVRAAGEFDLEVTVDALNGHLSSYDFLPSWVITWHTSNLFTDPLVKAGQTDLISQLATRLREEPNATGMTVGNEFRSTQLWPRAIIIRRAASAPSMTPRRGWKRCSGPCGTSGQTDGSGSDSTTTSGSSTTIRSPRVTP